MTARTTWFWVGLAVLLAGGIFLKEKFWRPEKPAGPGKVLPNLKPSEVTRLQIRPRNQLEIRAERTNQTWLLTAPLAFPYPAQSLSIEGLLSELEKLVPATYISSQELKTRPNADEEYGFTNPQATIILQQGTHRTQVLVGGLTSPGDQVFVQVVGIQGVHVVDSHLLQLVPTNVNEWRDRSVARLQDLNFDHISVTNGPRAFELRRGGRDEPWRMTSPIEARADQQRLQILLETLSAARIEQFVSDDAQTDLEQFGLLPPALQLTFGHGTNAVVSLQFGKSPTNDVGRVYARRPKQNALFTVAQSLVEGWRAPVNDFRDPFLVASVENVQSLEIFARDNFALERGTNDTWRVLPQDWAADAELCRDLLATLGRMRIVEFTKDIVTPIDLPTYGLAVPSARYILKSGTAAATNGLLAELDFGTNVEQRVFVRRPDESSVYAVGAKDFSRLPTQAIQMRDRALWSISETELSGVTIRQNGKVRQLTRQAAHEWSLAPGSQGEINELAVEEAVRPLCRLIAWSWVARGEDARKLYGLAEPAHQLTLEFKNGEKKSIDFGAASPTQSAYAGITKDGEYWIFEFPPSLYRFVATYLTIPAEAARAASPAKTGAPGG